MIPPRSASSEAIGATFKGVWNTWHCAAPRTNGLPAAGFLFFFPRQRDRGKKEKKKSFDSILGGNTTSWPESTCEIRIVCWSAHSISSVVVCRPYCLLNNTEQMMLLKVSFNCSLLLYRSLEERERDSHPVLFLSSFQWLQDNGKVSGPPAMVHHLFFSPSCLSSIRKVLFFFFLLTFLKGEIERRTKKKGGPKRFYIVCSSTFVGAHLKMDNNWVVSIPPPHFCEQ